MSWLYLQKCGKGGDANMEVNRIYCGDFRALVKQMPDEYVQTCITSPPYWSLRDYGLKPVVWDGDEFCEHVWASELAAKYDTEDNTRWRGNFKTGGSPNTKSISSNVSQGQFCQNCGAWRGSLGLEPSPEMYVNHIVDIFREVRRVLRPDGSCWINIADSYAGSPAGNTDYSPYWKTGGIKNAAETYRKDIKRNFGKLKPKDLCLIPQRLAIALQMDGWWIRSIIIWSKPNPMPESVTDRPTTGHEYVLLLSKSKKYYYDADGIREPHTWIESKPRPSGMERNAQKYRDKVKYGGAGTGFAGHSGTNKADGTPLNHPSGRNKRTVWEIATEPFPEAHFATFPKKLIEPMILAGTSPKACERCGAPWERVVERNIPKDKGMQPAGWEHRGFKGERQSNAKHREFDEWLATHPPRVTGWRPTCNHYDELYKAQFPKARSGRKRWQRDTSGNWWKRVRKRPGKPAWPWKPCVVLDPFIGSGTTAVEAANLGRDYIGIDANPDYTEMAERRIKQEAPNLVFQF